MTDGDEPGFDRHGAPWAEDDYLQIVACLQRGLSDGAVALALGRILSALQARARVMVGSEHKRSTALNVLRARLDYDWRAPVQGAAAEQGYHFWTRAVEETVARGWVDAIPMPTSVANLGLKESVIVRQLLGLRLASGTEEIVNQHPSAKCILSPTTETHQAAAGCRHATRTLPCRRTHSGPPPESGSSSTRHLARSRGGRSWTSCGKCCCRATSSSSGSKTASGAVCATWWRS